MEKPFVPHQGQQQTVGSIHIEGNVQGERLFTFNQTQIIQVLASEIKKRPLNLTSPYKGLKRFERNDKDLFFGRDQFLAGLVDELQQTNLVLLLGASGSGKSSVIRAGLLPWFAKKWGSNLVELTFTPGQDPFDSFYTALRQHYQQSEVEFVRQTPKDNTFLQVAKTFKQKSQYWLILIDQFEELFTISPAEQRDRFINSLLHLYRKLSPAQSCSIKIIATMRADFLDRLSPYPKLVKATDKHRPFIAEMQPDELRLAIEQPAAQHGVVFQEGLVKEIIEDVWGQAGYLPLLQYTLNLLWETEVTSGHIQDQELNRETYGQLGGVWGALEKHVEQIYQSLSKPKQDAAKRIFLKIVEIGGDEASETDWKPVRRRALRSEFTTLVEQETLEELINKSLLISTTVAEKVNTRQSAIQSTIEIAHEALLTSWKTLNQWIKENRQGIALRNRLNEDVQHWLKTKSDDELWSGSKLEKALELRNDKTFNEVLGGFSPDANQFIDASVGKRDRQQQRELKRARRIAIAATSAAVVIGIVSIAAFFQWQEAQRRSILAAAESARANLLANRSMEGTIAAVKAARLLDNPFLGDREALYREVSDALIWANSETKERLRLQGIAELEFSPDSKFILTANRIEYGEIVTLRSITGDPLTQLKTEDGLDSIQFSPDSKFLINNSQEDDLQLWSTSGQLIKELPGSAGELVLEDGRFAEEIFSRSSQTFVTSDSKTTKLWNASGEQLTQCPGEFKQFAEYSAEPGTKKIILITQDNNTTKLWNINGSPIASVPGQFQHIEAEKNLIITAQTDDSIKLWTLSGQAISAKVPGVFYDFEGTTLLTFDEKFAENKTAFHLWNISNQSLQSIPYTFTPSAHDLSPDGQYLLTGGQESNGTQYSVKLWAIAKNSITPRFTITRPFPEDSAVGVNPSFHADGTSIILTQIGETSNFPALVDFSGNPLIETQPDDPVHILESSKHLATLGEDRAVNLWNSSGNLITQFKNSQDGSPLDEVFSPDDQFFATITPRGTMQLWDLSSNRKTLVPRHQFSSAARPLIEFSPNGQFLVYYTQNPPSISLWNISGDPIAQFLVQSEKYINFVEFGPDNQVLAISSENSLRLWDLSSRSFTGFQESSESDFKFSLDGKQIVTANEGTIKIWDIPSNQLIKSFKVSPDISLMGLNKNSEIVIIDSSNEENPTIQIWNTSGKLVRSFNADQEMGYTVLSPDKNLIAGNVTTETDEVFVQLWDSSGKVIAEKLPGDFQEFSPNGEVLATIDRNRGIVYLWRSDGTSILELPGYQSLSSVRFSADSQLVVVGHGDDARSVLDTSGRLIVNLPAMQSGILNIRFSPTDGKLLATLGRDNTIKLLRLDDRNTLLQTACNQILAYLQSPASELSESDRRLCDGIVTSP